MRANQKILWIYNPLAINNAEQYFSHPIVQSNRVTPDPGILAAGRQLNVLQNIQRLL